MTLTQIFDIIESSLIRTEWCLNEETTKEERTRYLNDSLEGLRTAVIHIENYQTKFDQIQN